MRAGDAERLGFVEWFRMGDTRHVEDTVTGLRAAGVRRLRTQLSWAEHHSPGGPEWYDWLLPHLSAAFDVMVCVHYTPPSLSRTGRTTGAPKRLRDYADFIDEVLTRHGAQIDTVELWNEPNNLLDWDWRADPDYRLFCEMVGDAAHWVRERGFRAVLGGTCPFDPVLMDLMGRRGLYDLVSAVGVHGFPGTWDSAAGSWRGWEEHLAEARAVLARYNPNVELWITEAGFSTWDHDDMEQLRRFREASRASADRIYWYSWRDIAVDVAVQEGLWFDARHYHLGVVDAGNRPKLVGRLLTEGGLARLDAVAKLAAPALRRAADRPVVITGGSGFVGTNLAESFLADGDSVVILDNLSRPGVDENLAWLRDAHGGRVRPHIADIRSPRALGAAIEDARAVIHLAAQTAVTTSLAHPVDDFEVNARGTLNLLEAVRAGTRDAPFVFASTNKVYGDLADLDLEELEGGYLPRDPGLRRRGVNEDRPLAFCTPYGCSKGVADQYVLDYAKAYGMRTAVLRMSCIYGPHQFGTEDQGWVAHFLLRALAGEEITIYGGGQQVRDILHVRDAVAAYRAMVAGIDAVAGRAFNLGGGSGNAVSLNMLLAEIGSIAGHAPRVRHDRTRQGDQPYFVADTARLEAATGWHCGTAWQDGVAQLWEWLARNRFASLPLVYGKRKASA